MASQKTIPRRFEVFERPADRNRTGGFGVFESARRPRKLGRAFYERPVVEVARDVLGAVLCRRRGDGRVIRGTIVEVEAYAGPDDRASHARFGRTARTAPMFERGGTAYVFRVYGVHDCLNVATGPAGDPAAVLFRAVDLGDGTRRASGPGKLTRAFAVDRSFSGCSFVGSQLWIEPGPPVAPGPVARTARVGVAYAGEWANAPMRFVFAGHPALSGPRSLDGRGSG